MLKLTQHKYVLLASLVLGQPALEAAEGAVELDADVTNEPEAEFVGPDGATGNKARGQGAQAVADEIAGVLDVLDNTGAVQFALAEEAEQISANEDSKIAL